MEAAQSRAMCICRQYFVYILASRRNGTLYTGFTSNPVNRIANHKNDLIEGFTKRYGVHRLVWFEIHQDVHAAIRREKRIKRWRRAWKLRLIEAMNPDWEDLYDRFF
jgi:putative endonuclease